MECHSRIFAVHVPNAVCNGTQWRSIITPSIKIHTKRNVEMLPAVFIICGKSSQFYVEIFFPRISTNYKSTEVCLKVHRKN